MLHERRLVDGFAQDLGRVYAAKLRFLDWLLRTPPHTLNDNAQLVAHFGQAFGEWLWDRIRQPQTRTTFGHAVIALANQAISLPAQAIAVADSITHDAEFHTNWNLPANELQFPRLHPDWLPFIKNVAEPFYGWFGSIGFKPEPFALAGGMINRATVMKAFRLQSNGVCGYCDGPLGEVGSETEANDCDHFFTKSNWPHLAIHPANLFSACMGCNSRWKLGKTPMGDADAYGLNGTYHPMLRPGASLIKANAKISTKSNRQLEIEITDPAVPLRAITLNETLDLNARWTNYTNEKLDPKVSTFVAKTVRDKGRGWAVTPETIRDLIDDDIIWKQKNVGKEEHSIRLIAVLNCMRDEMLHEIISELA